MAAEITKTVALSFAKGNVAAHSFSEASKTVTVFEASENECAATFPFAKESATVLVISAAIGSSLG